MADKIDRSVEPELGADDKKKVAKKARELSPGVRVRTRSNKDAPSKKKAATKQETASANVKDNKGESELSGSKRFDSAELEMKLEGVDSKISNLSEELISTVRAMEASGSKLNEQESRFVDSINEFKVYKEQQQKISSVVVSTSLLSVLVACGFLVFSIINFGSKNDLFDSASRALSMRITEMDSGLTSFEAARSQLATLQEQIEVLELRIEESQLSYESTEQDIQGQLVNYSQDISQELANQAENLRENLARLDDRFSIFNAQILDFGDVLAESENTLGEISDEARSLNDLRVVMDALLTLERERYYEAINGSASQNRRAGIVTEGSSSSSIPTFNRFYNR